MPANQNFYIIQHGIRMSGMPGWKNVMSEREMWQLTGFLEQMHNLSADVSNQWKTIAGVSARDPDLKPTAPDDHELGNMKM